ncbi:Alpha/beta hydrolase family protein [Vibrio mediterranei]|uniref:Lipase n=1 Tax=Vibrio mediterranei TaxID=689 RepID=A0ABX5DB89_9VIBR|nr:MULTISPECIES: alpha/beta fold hydrolase [Vibrio]KFA98483.1 lipase [Vibrio sp. ER1A]MCG9659669.1 alpha/beta fold hydrolase [Vibrio mediterranei]NOI23168.1 alpha/beta fold hydrolase [Vibrio mediterranei]PCD87232.1 lipase [Vibrio mediterranei]PRQ66817.1 lipase [Vibrio mediterranei]
MKWKVSMTILTALALVGCSKPEIETVDSELNAHHLDQVVVVHGLARSAWSMQNMSKGIAKQGYQVCVVDYPTLRQPIENTLAESAKELSRCIDEFNHSKNLVTNQSKIHFVGHSLGGLVIRSYLAQHPDFVDSSEMGKVVFVGTPNHGSDVADFFSDTWMLSLVGGTAESLTTSPNSFPNSLPTPNYDFGVIAGTQSYPVFSGMFSKSNDGLVSVESTKLDGMRDFIEVDIKHDRLRRDPYVTSLVLNFIETDKFESK